MSKLINSSLKEKSVMARIRVLLSALLLTFFTGGSANADDIEIYQGLTAGDTQSKAQRFKPNLLFVLDTSGSMKTPEAVDFSQTYDPNIDYGSSPSDRYYVYDSEWNYTGVNVSSSLNFCKASKDYIDDPKNSGRPAFLGEVLIWQNSPAFDSQIDPNCNASDGDTFEFDRTSYPWCWFFGCINVHRMFFEERIDVSSSYTVNMSSSKSGSFRAELIGINRWGQETGNVASCDYMEVDEDEEYVCELIPDRELRRRPRLKLTFYHEGSQGNVNADIDVQIQFAGTTCASRTSPAIVDWVDQYDADRPVTEYNGIECAADSQGDGHGKTDASANRFPRYQGNDPTDNPQDPKFTSSQSDSLTVQWGVDSISDKYIIPANYHDFRRSENFNLNPSQINRPESGETALDFCQEEEGHLNFVNKYKWVYDSNGEVKRCIPRIELLKKATDSILTQLSDVNVGLMRYNYQEAGTLVSAIKDIDKKDADGDEINRADLIDAMYSLPADGATPIQETMYTAYQYYSGGDVVGAINPKRVAKSGEGPREYDPDTKWQCTNENNTDACNNIHDADGVSGGKFISPIQGECQDNAIILLSDGDATSDTTFESQIEALGEGRCRGNVDGDCLDELTAFMANQDKDVYTGKVNAKDDDGNTIQVDSGDNHVYTYTVAFGSGISDGSDDLEKAAQAGQRPNGESQFFVANDSDQLVNRFETIIKDLKSVASDSFVAPAVAVNAFNRLQFREDLYFALFQPENSPRWRGNIKKYKIDPATGAVVDANNREAIGENGFFKDSAVSLWGSNSLQDGPNVLKGGVVAELDLQPTARQLYASLDTNTTTLTQLQRSDFLEKVEAAGLTAADLGAISSPDLDTNVERLIDWSFGYEIPEDGSTPSNPNYYFGESLHSTPFVVDFGDATNHKDILFVATNQGMIHAIDGQTGEEKWAYIPDPSLFKNLGVYYNNLVSSTHQYGLDSELTFDIKRDIDGKLTRANVYLGQRRGGNKYFGLDISNSDSATAPVKKMWTIDGLPNAGQSWAEPVMATVNFCKTATSCENTEVLFISGGYDTRYDELVTVSGASQPKPLSELAGNVKGNAIYMVRRSDGALLWMAGRNAAEVNVPATAGYFLNSDMVHGFPTAPTVIDSDFDGIADFIYAVDIAGNVWRFDFVGDASSQVVDGKAEVTIDENDIHVGNALKGGDYEVNGGIIAKLSDESDNRRFFNRLDVSLTPRDGNELARFNIVTGSGVRSNPTIDEVAENRLYFLFDRNTFYPQFSFDADGNPNGVTYNYKSTTEKITSSDISNRFTQDDLDLSGDHKYGFYIPMSETGSEKMLNPTLTDDGIVIAVSYSPEDSSTTDGGVLCQGGVGSSYLYQIDLLTGKAASTQLDKAGISARPVVIEVQNPDALTDPDAPKTKKVLIIGSESFDASSAPTTEDDPDSFIDDLKDPGLNEGNVGNIKKINWWERRKR